jgi:hypothetical protein
VLLLTEQGFTVETAPVLAVAAKLRHAEPGGVGIGSDLAVFKTRMETALACIDTQPSS